MKTQQTNWTPERISHCFEQTVELLNANVQKVYELTSERDELRKQRDKLKRELQRVLDFFGRDEEKGLLPAGFATFNGAREAINEASNLNK